MLDTGLPDAINKCHSGLEPESRGMMKTYYIYILASKKNGTLYIGITNDLLRRIYEHKSGTADGFTKKYDLISLSTLKTRLM